MGDEAEEQIRIFADKAGSHSSFDRSNALVFQKCISQFARKTVQHLKKGQTALKQE